MLKEDTMKSKKTRKRDVDNGSVGKDIRALRKSRSVTLSELANCLNRSVGFISQIERGLSSPSINDLRAISEFFGIPISFFFGDNASRPDEAKHIVRASSRRQIGSSEAGLVEELLSPDLSGDFEAVHSEFLPGAFLQDCQQRDTEEAGYVISGVFEIEIDGTWHTLNAGDSFRLMGEPYRWRNQQDTSAHLIWVISPPIY